MKSPFGQGNQTQPMVALGGVCRLDDITGIYIYVFALLLLLLAIVGANTLVLTVLIKHAHLRTSTNISYGVLSFIDWLKGAGLIPVLIWTTLVKVSIGKRSYFDYHNLVVRRILVYGNFFTMGTLLFIGVNQMLMIRRAQNIGKMEIIIGLGVCLFGPIMYVILIECGVSLAAFPGFIYLYLSKVVIILAHIIAFCRVRRYRRTGYNDVDESMVDEMCNGLKTSSLVSALNIGVYIIMTVFVALVVLQNDVMQIFCASAIYMELVCSSVNPLIYILRIPDMKRSIVGLFKKMGSGDEEQVIVAMEDNNEDSDTQCLI